MHDRRLPTLRSSRHPLASPERQLEALAATDAPAFDTVLRERGLEPLASRRLEVLQVNVGKLCNQTCAHCHVDAGPDRDEVMTPETADLCLEALRCFEIPTLDLTGGAPELNPCFRDLVVGAKNLGAHVIDRCNLTVLLIRAQADLVDFLARHEVEVVASLPSFRASGTDAQRGENVFEKSIEALRRLNAAGYGRGGKLKLNLVHNPVGAFLPGSQTSIERDYRRALEEHHGVTFDQLFTITNMPISRFLEYLERSGNLERYMETLVGAFNPAAVQGVMCLDMLSVGYDGTLYDCDFNQMLEMPVGHGAPRTLRELLEAGTERTIVTDRHCFGCTAGAGSSCGGALED
jgi:radical SAM/Cys-rich protein